MMNTDSEVASLVSLELGGIGVSLSCQDAALANLLNQRYVTFTSPKANQFQIKVEYLPDITADTPYHPAPEILFKDGILHLEAPGYAGYIDERQGYGQLRLSTLEPVDGIDYFLRVTYALLAFYAGGWLFHAAGIVRRGQTYLFFGHSGSGKTTVSRLSTSDIVLNDDLVLVLPDNGGWRVESTPFWNPTQVQPSHLSAPLAGLYHLVQNSRVYLEEMNPGQALAELISNTPVITCDPQLSLELIARGRQFLDHVPAYRLHFLPDASFWSVIAP